MTSSDLPTPVVTFDAGPNERALAAHAEGTLRAIWDAVGAQDVWSFPRFAHTAGTCRMGADRDTSVVDPDGHSHELPNFTISDNSDFPGALATKSSLTIMALLPRTADRHLARRETWRASVEG